MAAPTSRASAYFSASLEQFLATDVRGVLGILAAAHGHDLEVTQRQAWEEGIEILRSVLDGLTGTLYLEFDVPRLGSRIDG